MWFNLQHWTSQGDWHFNPKCWPDPQGMFDELQTMGIELMVTFWPFQSTESVISYLLLLKTCFLWIFSWIF
jgi:alpha-glucosidase (family GH31 glycosyl hydrolase)